MNSFKSYSTKIRTLSNSFSSKSFSSSSSSILNSQMYLPSNQYLFTKQTAVSLFVTSHSTKTILLNLDSNPNSYTNSLSSVRFSSSSSSSSIDTSSIDTPSIIDTTSNLVEHSYEQPWTVVEKLSQFITSTHELTGLPYWSTIVLVTVGMRTLILPFALKQMKTTAILQAMQPEVEDLNAKMSAAYKTDPTAAAVHAQNIQKVWAKYDYNPAAGIMFPLIQAPMFIVFFMALRHMGEAPFLYPGFTSGGLGPFMDLSVPDPTYVLPALSAASFLLTFELGADGAANTSQMGKMKWFMRALSVAIFPITMSLPQGVFFYWLTSSAYSMAQLAVTKHPTVRSWLGVDHVASSASSLKDAKVLTQDQLRKLDSKSIQIDTTLSEIKTVKKIPAGAKRNRTGKKTKRKNKK